MIKKNYDITGMSCAACVARVEKGLAKLEGVTAVTVNLASEKAEVTFDADKISDHDIKDAIKSTGYDVIDTGAADIRKIDLAVSGMSCAACVSRVEKSLSKLDGITAVTINLASEKASVTYDPGRVMVNDMLQSVKQAGYDAQLINDAGRTGVDEAREREVKKMSRWLFLSIFLSLPLLAGMFSMLIGINVPLLHDPVFQLVFAAPVQFVIGWRFYRNAWHGLRSLSPGMDLLVALGTSAAFALSMYNGFIAHDSTGAHPELYFEASVVIITLVLLGKYLEARAKGKTSEAIKKLMALKPHIAHVEKDGAYIDLPAGEVVPGDRILVKPGESIPVDGTVVHGSTAVDESMLTGESLPIDKVQGSKLIAGTVNMHGAVTFIAEKVGRDTALARIIRIVEEAQGTKAPVQRLADRVAAVFVPAIIAIAVITFFLWLLISGSVSAALIASVSVLVIACPCALGLATPTALIVGTGRGAQLGILIKNAEALERVREINAVIFDKTGTITSGRPRVNNVVTFDGIEEAELLRITASAENSSEHPLAKAIVDKARDNGLSFEKADSFKSLPGMGIEVVTAGRKVLAGKPEFLKKQGINVAKAEERINSLESEGMTVIAVALDNKLSGLLGISDSLRESSAEGIRQIQSMGIETFLVTGDNERTALSVAHQVGINADNVKWGVLPEEKARVVRDLQGQGKKIAMVGDGINDAPALASADIGIAIGSGTDIAMESGDMTLVKGDLKKVVLALKLSRRTMSKIKQNLFWAFFYNAVGIPFAASGFLSPIIAGAAMAFSSVSVVTNSLSLKRIAIK